MALAATPLAGPPELELRRTLPVFVNSFEQVTYLRDSVDWFHRNGFGNITVMEQGSIFPPLVDYLASPAFLGKARLMPLKKNVGPRRAVRKAAEFVGLGNPFIFTDPDLQLPTPIDPQFLTRLFALGRHYSVSKVGLALDLSDPEKINLQQMAGPKHTVSTYYRRFFQNKLESNVWGCGIDTTFFLHVPQPAMESFGIMTSQPRIPAVRIGGPGFLAGHRPWYFVNGMTPEEELHYRSRTTIASTTFGRAA